MEKPPRTGRSGNKRKFTVDNDADNLYKFKVLLPNGTSISLTLKDNKVEVPFDGFIEAIKKKYLKVYKPDELKKRRPIGWGSEHLYILDENDCRVRTGLIVRNFAPDKCHILRLYDGSAQVPGTYENMWDLTPDTELLAELPEEYTFETALADLIDNSLQAVWSNEKDCRRLISVNIHENRISIFDTGPGMDGSDENSLLKWGKMGASLHRRVKRQAIGGKPPYLRPFFGMFGYGGPIASMHLGRRALISSKTKDSKKVYVLHLVRESLLRSSGSGQPWTTSGSIRDPFEEEIREAPHGSFTKVEIFEPKMKRIDICQLQCKLKDIYFPYVQCDELTETGRKITIQPIEFQVNGIDLAEVTGGEVALTNLHSCNGPEFELELHFSCSGTSLEANARLKCIYIPVVGGEENIDRILEKLRTEGCGNSENYKNFSHVSVRRLGRLLPDARWPRLPFMDLMQRKGDKANLLKRLCSRVKCFIDTDAGFSPTTSKTDLAHQNSFTTALKNFGSKQPVKEEIQIKVYRDGKLLTPIQLEKQFQEWILRMHDHYDEESDSGEDQPVLVVNPANKKALGISSDVVRVHQILRRKGIIWKRDQKIKILKGAYAGFHKTNVFATIEYFLLEGFQGEASGEARIICRQLGVGDEAGCVLEVNGGNARLDICSSFSLPISVIDSRKCVAVESKEWDCQIEKRRQKEPSMIEVLGARHCQRLEIDGVLPTGTPVIAGSVPPMCIVAVVRPASFFSATGPIDLEPKFIVKSDMEMSMGVTWEGNVEDNLVNHLFSTRIKCSSHRKLQGLYIFPLGSKRPDIFKKSGTYTFSFFLDGERCKCEKKVRVTASSKIGKWKILNYEKLSSVLRVGSCLTLNVACYDIYENRTPFSTVPDVKVKLKAKEGVLLYNHNVKAGLSPDNLILRVEDIVIESNQLEAIKPSYEATLVICQLDEKYSASIPCQVLPGSVESVTVQPSISKIQLVPDCTVVELVLQFFDAYGNYAMQGSEVQLDLDGLQILDRTCRKHQVDIHGRIDLSGVVKVTAGYGKKVSLAILSDNGVLYREQTQTEIRELKLSSKLPKFCSAGSQLKNVIFEVRNSDGFIDTNIHDEEKSGQPHTLVIISESQTLDDSVRYIFRHGQCVVPSIAIPNKDGNFCFSAVHSRHTELCLNFEIPVMQAPKVEIGETQSSCSDRQIIGSSYSKEHLTNTVMSASPMEQQLHIEVIKLGKKIGDSEEMLKALDNRKQNLEQKLYELPGLVESRSWDNEMMMEHIESRVNSAPAVICSLSKELPSREPEDCFLGDVVGIVALLGTVGSYKLSRMLAQFLGEEQMLAIVCRSYAAASAMESYKENGDIDVRLGLHSKAASIGRSIDDPFTVMCLEDLRPYDGGSKENDPQRRLLLPDPGLPAGDRPLGFMGYAVNMINIDACNLITTTGHDLRETLFYNLFKELQVYDTRAHMNKARAYIIHGAISLDGGIIREKGILPLGFREPEIYFPIRADNQVQISPEIKEVMAKTEEYKEELSMITARIKKTSKKHEKYVKKFKKKELKLWAIIEPMCLEYKPAIDRETGCSSSH